MNSMDIQSINTLVECRNVSKTFYEGPSQTEVLKEINFTLKAKERIAILGPSASGKSTFLHILAGLDHLSSGAVSVMGHPIHDCSMHLISHIRNRYIGFIYQFHHLLSEFSVLENVAMPLLIRGEKRSTVQDKALKVLERLGLRQKAHAKPSELSGGEKQRAAVGRAIITEPAFILADEPTGNLDSTTAHSIIDVLCNLHQTSIVMVTHDYSIAKRMDKILKLEKGHLTHT